MAVTKIWDIRGNLSQTLGYIENPEKTIDEGFGHSVEDQGLADVMAYAANEDKTEKRMYVSGINCNTTCARNQFMTVKKAFDKQGGIVAYHAYQSFAPGETTPAEAHEIGKELAKRLWGDKFQVVVATHLNTNCLHNHFVINSVSFKDGKRYHDCKATYRELQRVSDQICRERGLSVVEQPNRKEAEKLWIAQASARGEPTRYNLARAAIDEAISNSTNMHEFERYLKRLGYTTQFSTSRKYWTIIPPGYKKPIRLAKLGEAYTNERIHERIVCNYNKLKYDTFQKARFKPKQYIIFSSNNSAFHKGLRGLYFKYCYMLGYLPKRKVEANQIHPLLREDLLIAEKISMEARLLEKFGIENMRELKSLECTLTAEYNELEGIPDSRERRREIRKELSLCEDIEKRSEEMERRMKEIEKEQDKEREVSK